ncbi:wax ester synthase-like Acyl-CoA acyltransferase domain protein [Mycobacterium avium subsp. avium 2285 (R)]|nr:wax ester synthase-like Acyl-CoA acyltransferase domain protein [Mycobacterium avium subsp. avium 2285 (R)]
MHTIKAAVIELDADRRSLDVAAFRQVIAGRLNKLDPFCYQLVEVPFSFHHPMWRENCEIDLDYHIRPWRVSPPGGRRELDEAIGQIASTPLDRSRPLWEMYFVEGLANNRIAVVGKIHHALADGVASANLLARGMDLQPGPEAGPYVCDPPPTTRQLMVSAFADHLRHVGRLPHTIRYTAQGLGRVRRSARKLSPELTRPFEPPPTFMNHKLTRSAGSPPPPWRWPTSRRPASGSARRSTTWCWRCRRGRCAPCCCATTDRPSRCWRRCP